MDANILDSIGYLLALSIPVGASAVLYFWPSILAFRKAHEQRWGILLVNVTLGWTTLVWLIALIWALRSSAQDV